MRPRELLKGRLALKDCTAVFNTAEGRRDEGCGIKIMMMERTFYLLAESKPEVRAWTAPFTSNPSETAQAVWKRRAFRVHLSRERGKNARFLISPLGSVWFPAWSQRSAVLDG